MPDFPDLLLWAIPGFILFIALEVLWLKYRPIENAYTFKDAATSMIMGTGMSAMNLLTAGITLGFLMLIWQFRVFDLGWSLPIILLALVVDDFFYYWKHLAP